MLRHLLELSDHSSCMTQLMLNARYLKLLQHHLVSTLQGMGVNTEETFFQQDGARPHFLSENFHNTVINN
jgi:hypothetical protein